MLKRSVIGKTLSAFLIFTLASANFIFIVKSYATTIFDKVFFNNSATGEKNIVFDAYFNREKDKRYSIISDINDDSVKLCLNISVQNFGYLKNAYIEIKEKEETSKLNFRIEGEVKESDYVKNFESNKIILKQISKNSQVNLELPITYLEEEYINIDKLKQNFKVILTGTYVNDKAEEIQINKECILNITWIDKREVKLSSEVTKYIPYLIDERKRNNSSNINKSRFYII